MSTTVNLHAAKTQLSRLVDQAAKGQEIIIAKAGKPLVRLVPVHPVGSERELGFLADRSVMRLDVKQGFADDIESMFPQPL
jgi:prevent-host-death family protein